VVSVRVGYNYRLLEIDLSSEKVGVVETDSGLMRKFIGGRALGAWILWSRFADRWSEIDPLGPENLLLFLAGPLVGYFPGGRLCVTGKSPETGGIIGSTVGTDFGIELKAAGYDGVIIKGRASSPVSILIHDDEVEFLDASAVWGSGGRETLSRLMRVAEGHIARKRPRDGIAKNPSILYIGPAGERKVRFSAIMSKWSHAAGYGGYGAVMGSKNLKAVIAKGTGPLPKPHDFEKFMKLFMNSVETLSRKNAEFGKTGTLGEVRLTSYEWSSHPVKNWQEEWYDNPEYSHATAERKFWVKKFWSDYGCPTSCMKVSRVEFKGDVGVTDGPDYELAAYLGPNLGVFDLDFSTYLSYLADEYGFDGINLGNVLGFAMELFERGILTEQDLGFRVSWGDKEGVLKLVRLILERKGLGDILAEGTYRAARRISELKGVDVLRFAVQVKGIGVGAHGNRVGLDYPQPISYALSTQGGDHTSVALLPKDHVFGELWTVFLDSAVTCLFNITEQEEMIEMLNSVTGFDISKEEFFDEIAVRALTIQRMALLIGGPDVKWVPGKDDDNPPRFYEPLPTGPHKGSKVDRDKFLEMRWEYFSMLGWDENGVPTEKTLEKLNLLEYKSLLP